MIVQVAPVEKNVLETLTSLNFAKRVRTVELGAASKKTETLEVHYLGHFICTFIVSTNSVKV